MATALEQLNAEVARFRAWSDSDPVPISQRSGEGECDYREVSHLYDAFTAFVVATSCPEWSEATVEMIPYAIGRDNEDQYLAREVAKNPASLLCLAEHAVERGRLGAGSRRKNDCSCCLCRIRMSTSVGAP
jgi:hypothetical protein